MEKEQIVEMAIRELTEKALQDRRDNLDDSEKQLHSELGVLSAQVKKIMQKLSEEEEQQILDDYIVKTNLIADHDCAYLYVQGAKDCVELLKKLGAL